MTIGQRIKARREELNLSQSELANRIGYKSRSSINKIELDQQNLRQSKIKAIADALDTTPAYIMGWEETAPQAPTPPPDDDITLLQSLDNIDRAEIRGTMKQMLKADKYREDASVSEAI